jgi:hypothetical protein
MKDKEFENMIKNLVKNTNPKYHSKEFEEDIDNLTEFHIKEEHRREADLFFLTMIKNEDFHKFLLYKLNTDLDFRKEFSNVMKDFVITGGKK